LKIIAYPGNKIIAVTTLFFYREMKNLLFLFIMLLFMGFADARDCSNHDKIAEVSDKKFSELYSDEKTEALDALLNGDCHYKGIKLWGKVKFVTSFPDIKIQYVDHFPDIRVKFVSSFPDKCGLWQIVDNFPDIKVQVVNHFPDIKVKVVEHFPGVD
jgi:hypothetical protein